MFTSPAWHPSGLAGAPGRSGKKAQQPLVGHSGRIAANHVPQVQLGQFVCRSNYCPEALILPVRPGLRPRQLLLCVLMPTRTRALLGVGKARAKLGNVAVAYGRAQLAKAAFCSGNGNGKQGFPLRADFRAVNDVPACQSSLCSRRLQFHCGQNLVAHIFPFHPCCQSGQRKRAPAGSATTRVALKNILFIAPQMASVSTVTISSSKSRQRQRRFLANLWLYGHAVRKFLRLH